MDKKYKKLIRKFLKGELNADETSALEEWIKHPDNKESLKDEVQLHYRLNTFFNRFDTDKGYQEHIELRADKKVKQQYPFRRLLPYAAILLPLLGLAWVLFILQKDRENTLVIPETQITLQLEDGSLMNITPEENRNIQTRDGHTVSSQKQDTLYYNATSQTEALAYNTLKVPYGKTFSLRLSDGSLVHLNAGTELRYPRQFIEGERRVYLKGEAYFEVTPDKNSPFIVTTPETDTRVLGTTFNVSAYKEEGVTTTVLVEGSVLVSEKEKEEGSGNSAILTPGELALWDGDDKKMQVSQVDVTEYIAWVKGELLFENRTFQELLRVLERRYNVTIDNRYPELNNGRYRAYFKEETIEQVLKTFVKSRLFSYTIKDNIIIIERPTD